MKANLGSVRVVVGVVMGLIVVLAFGSALRAQQGTEVQIAVKGHHFQPASLHAPANQPLAIRVKNLDEMPMEFESVSLRVEKVIPAGGEGVVHVRPLAAGQYEFFDDFHQETRGTLSVQ